MQITWTGLLHRGACLPDEGLGQPKKRMDLHAALGTAEPSPRDKSSRHAGFGVTRTVSWPDQPKKRAGT